MLLFANLLIALLPLFSQALQHNGTRFYSEWMASSIISRQQGVAPVGESSLASSVLLRAGVFQTALIRLIQYYPESSSTHLFRNYLYLSMNTTTPYILNATLDTKYPLDYLSLGIPLLYVSQQAKYRGYPEHILEAIRGLRKSIDLRNRNQFQGLWYYTYPNWSYLDGMFSLAPFYADYVAHFLFSIGGKPVDASRRMIADDLLQLDLLWEKSRRNDTPPGLLVHGYDASKTAVWADPINGASPHVWGRSLGWYAVALVETLGTLPVKHSSEEWTGLQARFEILMDGVVKAADTVTGAWWQVMDQPGKEGNYIESSSSALFIVALLRGVRLGYVKKTKCTTYVDAATKAYEYIVEAFVVDDGNNTLGYNGTVSVCSLNSMATYKYYVNQPLEYNSVLGAGNFVEASLEYELLKQNRWKSSINWVGHP